MLKINEVERIYLGIQGENNARPITIDVSPWIALYPNGSVTIWHKRNGDSVPEATGAVYDSETIENQNISVNCVARSCATCRRCYSRETETIVNEKLK